MIKHYIISLFLLLPAIITIGQNASIDPAQTDMISASTSEFKLIENKGQWDELIAYKANLSIGALFLEKDALTFNLHEGDLYHRHHGCATGGNVCSHNGFEGHAFRIEFMNASPEVGFTEEYELPFYHNYFIGNDESKWAGNVRLYNEVTYRDLYSDIDMKIFGKNEDRIKYEFYVAPGGDPDQIALQYVGLEDMRLRKGALFYSTTVADIEELAPYAYQVIEGKYKKVACNYILRGNTVTFEFPKGYDNSYELVIDPTLVFSSYSGSTGDNFGYTATYDDNGNLYGGGIALATGYPTVTGSYQTTFAGGNPGGNGILADMAISKFNAAGNNLIYSTYIGGSDNDQPHSMIVDAAGNLHVYGRSYSNDYPVTTGALDPTHNGGSDIVVSKLNIGGTTMIGSTFLGGSGDDGVNIAAQATTVSSLKFNYADDARGEIILDDQGDIYIASCTRSTNLQTFQATQNALAGSQDACVFKLNSNLTLMLWGTYLGGSGDDAAYSLKLDGQGNLFTCGGTSSTNFPASGGALLSSFQGGRADGFIAKYNANNGVFQRATYNGTSDYDQNYFIEIDEKDFIYVYGQTEGSYPVSPGVYNNPGSSQFIHKLGNNLNTTEFSTVFGSGSSRINISPTAFLVDKCENIYISGWGGSTNGVNP